MKRFIKLISILTTIGAIILAITGCSSSNASNASNTGGSSSNKPKVVNIGFQVAADDIVLVKAKHLFENELAKQEIKLKYTQFNAGRDINNAIASNSIDFGDVGDPPAAIGISSGLNYKLIWLDYIIGDAEALAVKNKSNIQSLKDLKGKRIGTTVSSTAHYSLLKALNLVGLDAKDVTIVDLNPQDIVASWQRGNIDAAYTWDPNLSELLKDGHVLISSKQLANKGALTSISTVVRSDFAKKYPNIVSLYIKQLIKAHELYKNNPNDAIQAIAQELSISKDEAARQAQGYIWLTGDQILSSKYYGTSASKGDYEKSLKKIAGFLVEQKALKTAPDISEFEKAVDSQYLENALKK